MRLTFFVKVWIWFGIQTSWAIAHKCWVSGTWSVMWIPRIMAFVSRLRNCSKRPYWRTSEQYNTCGGDSVLRETFCDKHQSSWAVFCWHIMPPCIPQIRALQVIGMWHPARTQRDMAGHFRMYQRTVPKSLHRCLLLRPPCHLAIVRKLPLDRTMFFTGSVVKA